MRLTAITPAGLKRTPDRLGFGAASSRPARANVAAARAPRAPVAAPRSSRAGAAGRTATGDRVASRAAGRAATRPPGRAAAAGHPHRLRPKRAAPAVPRRVSGPVRRATPAAPPPRQSRRAPIAQRAAAFLRALPDHVVVDRLVRGRAWIPVLGVMLAGIVAMQVEVLKLGASAGRSIERSSALQTRNQMLRASVASLSDEGRIERLAAGMGMIMPTPGSVGFLSGSANAGQALANIHAPDPTSFLASMASNGAVVTNSIMSGSNGSITANPPGSGASATGTAGTTGTATTTGTTASSGTAAGSGQSTGTATTSPATTSPTTTSSTAATTTPTVSQPHPTAAPQQSSTQQPGATTGG